MKTASPSGTAVRFLKIYKKNTETLKVLTKYVKEHI